MTLNQIGSLQISTVVHWIEKGLLIYFGFWLIVFLICAGMLFADKALDRYGRNQ